MYSTIVAIWIKSTFGWFFLLIHFVKMLLFKKENLSSTCWRNSQFTPSKEYRPQWWWFFIYSYWALVLHLILILDGIWWNMCILSTVSEREPTKGNGTTLEGSMIDFNSDVTSWSQRIFTFDGHGESSNYSPSSWFLFSQLRAHIVAFIICKYPKCVFQHLYLKR